MRVGVLLLLPLLLIAQPEFFGYFESEIDGIAFEGETYLYQYNKLRLDVETYPADNIQIGANFNVQTYHGKTTWDLMDFLPEQTTEELVIMGLTELLFPIADTSYVDNAYMRIQFPRLDLTLGKQQLSFGTGYAWNPTDIFNYKQLLDPSYEQNGVSTLRLELPLAGRLNLDLIYQPEDDWEASAKLFQAKIGLGRFDISGVFGQYQWYRSDFFIPEGVTVERTLTGGSFVGEVLGIGVWAEGALNQLSGPEDDFVEYVLGADYTFESSTYILFEYLHNEAGKKDITDLDINDYFHGFGGETHSLMQNYGFLYAMHPVGDFGTLGLLGFANFDDQSAAINPSYDWAGFENINFSFLLSYMLGEPDTEFGVQDWGLRFRVRGYF